MSGCGQIQVLESASCHAYQLIGEVVVWDPYLSKFKRGCQPFLPDGEEVTAAFVARPHGWTQSTAGSATLGGTWQGRAYAAGAESGFEIASPMALAVTQRRLLVLRIGSPIGLGIGGAVKELVSAVPCSEVDSIALTRLLLGKVVTVTVRGVPVTLEANVAANVSGLIDAFNRARAGG
jgi:hypothetical protein